ncbi:MAG TPA: ribonuclease E inhibitor RraB [Candidatus Angelobacter sp.]|nr:ribonuclease E inhibitor RraB [Candidatus Angelobacter sp.]
MTHRVTILLVLLTMSLFNLFGSSKKPDLDELVLRQLKKAGSDLSKPHGIEFFLYFPTQSVAEQAAARIREQGFVVEVRPAAQSNSEWLCFATKTMVPDLSALQKIRRDFTALAASFDGQYDGWGTPVER